MNSPDIGLIKLDPALVLMDHTDLVLRLPPRDREEWAPREIDPGFGEGPRDGNRRALRPSRLRDV